jgi:hypothetical protein
MTARASGQGDGRMSRYAQDTSVSVEKSRAEIEGTVNRYGATGFISGWQGNKAMVAFEMRDRRIRFTLPLPDKNDKRFTHTPGKGQRRDDASAHREWEQGCRQAWRALALAIKAKLEAVEARISTFEEEFMANLVMANGLTLGEAFIPQLAQIISTSQMPPMLPGPGESTAN